MKKNNMLRLASVLLVAVLLSTCAVSGVFAYYQSTDSAEDEARVAKWGVVVDYDNVDMFKTTYETGNETVASSTTKDVVAPGTKGDLTGITITGKPEVDVQVTQEADLTLTGWTLANGDEYCPIVITVNTVEYYMGADVSTEILADGKIDSVADFETAVEAAIAAKSARYEANVELQANAQDDVVVSWEWAFGEDTDPAIDTIIANDTYLGNQAALDNAATINLVITTTITQID